MKKFLFLLCSLLFAAMGMKAETSVLRSTTLVTSADAIAEGKFYAFRVNGGSYITEDGGQYVAPNAQNTITDAAMYYISPNADGETFTVKNYSTNNYWGTLTGAATGTFAPSAEPADWTFAFNGNNVQAGSNGYFINRSSGVMHGWNSAINLQLYEVTETSVEYVTALADLVNTKSYYVTNARGTWNVADDAESMTTSSLNIGAVAEQFALISKDDNYYIYSVNAKKFLTSANTLGDPEAVTIVETGDANYPFFFKFDDAHNINVSGGRVIIDDWTTVDAGNSNAIIEAAEFDPFEALAAIDPTVAQPKNLDFAADAPLTVNVRTYAKDITGDDVAQMQPVEGWTIVENGDARAAGVYAYGSENFLGSAGRIAPATNPEGNAEGNALGIVAVWSGKTQYTQKVILPAANYILTIPVYNVNTNSSIDKNYIGFIEENGTEHLATATSYANGWTNEVVTFSLNEPTVGYLSLGYQSKNTGSGSAAHLFIDGIKIETATNVEVVRAELLTALVEPTAVVAAKAGVGEALFMIPEAAYNTFAAAVAAAQAVADDAEATAEEIEAAKADLAAAVEAYADAATKPEVDATYTIQQKSSGLYMALVSETGTDGKDDAVRIVSDAQAFSWVAAEGGYYLTNEVGYVGNKSNAWTTSVLEANKIVVNASPVIIDDKVYYTLTTYRGLIATDSDDDQSRCYLDNTWAKLDEKGRAYDAAYWTIAKVESEAQVALKAEIAAAEALLAAAEKEDGKTEFQAAIDAANAAVGTSDEEMTAALAALKTAEEAFAEAQKGKPEVAVLTYQKYIVKNVGSGLYWGAGNDWGTRASLIANPEFVKFDPTDMPEGQYKLESQVNNGGTQYYFNGDYMDNGSPVALVITKLPNGNYTIANAEDGKFYGYDGTSTVLGKGLTDADSENAQWTILSLDDAKAALANATVEKPMNATLLINDPNFGRNNRYSNKWEQTGVGNMSGGNNVNNCAESYHSTFTLSQMLEGAPAGVYAVTAQGFYRQDGEDNDNLPVFFANDETQAFPLKTSSENSMSDASVSFSAGHYTIDPIYVQVEPEGTLTIGAKLESNTALWCIWDNFVLTYYGADATINDARFATLIAQVKELRATAEALKTNENIGEVALEALNAALTATADVESTEEALTAAIATLTAAIEQAEGLAKLAVNIAAAERLVASTNVYTAEAKAAYEAIIAAAKANYAEGTVVSFDNPETLHGWHADNDYDDFLLSAWTINDVQCADFGTALYINTWSTEGENDGSDFKVPFFEYWTGDDNSLAANKLTATVEGLEVGRYEVSVWARVRAKNGYTAPAYGITADVNGGEAVDVTAGEQIGTSQFYLAEFKASGVVAEDGVLKFNINIAEDNNISWLSFKNVNYKQTADATQLAYEAAVATLKDGYTYRVSTKVGDDTYYLKSDGYLTANEDEATVFTFAKVAGEKYEYGFKMSGVCFTNPGMSGSGGSGDVVNEGHLKTNLGQNRNTWEAQVFFLKNGKYAVRATNANSSTWGANTYWDVLGTAELPEAGYSLEPNYVWNVDVFVDRTELDALIAKLDATVSATDTYTAEADVTETAQNALNTIKTTEYETIEAVNEAINAVHTTALEFFAAINPKTEIDITDFYIVNPTPVINQGMPKGWEGDKFGDSSNGVSEYWNKSGVGFHQIVSLPAGDYQLTVVALQRTGMAGYVYAGETKTTIAEVDNGTANSRSQAATWFDAGNGQNVVPFFITEAGEVEIGLKADDTTGDHWTVWREFKLAMLPKGAVGINGVANDLMNGEDTLIYDLSGRRVSKATKAGLYIINGKKVVIK